MQKPIRFAQILIVVLILRPFLYIVLGLNVLQKQNLPKDGPLILVANHNSHLDTAVLMSLFPLKDLHRVRPVAAADYWLSNRWVAWFATYIINVVPIDRVRKEKTDPLEPVATALKQGDIVLIFPEGSRGEPEQLSEFKSGVAHLARRFPEVPIMPVYMRGMGKSLPRGTGLLLPFFCEVHFGYTIKWSGSKTRLMQQIVQQIEALSG